MKHFEFDIIYIMAYSIKMQIIERGRFLHNRLRNTLIALLMPIDFFNLPIRSH
ncbi:hypothetical protein MBAV_002479 [Candidatus Magnetobacterium bavaricum]|uniref:Uncharacterized protein n=1 Tax=Candidatus Magnetobacterium bavaricum TaxID=29290 RepID=A0A0F3GTS8_9BACT|nr:hypothetical protein MBAV_002479 [Candidatus Magnetobacterium bavaricum]